MSTLGLSKKSSHFLEESLGPLGFLLLFYISQYNRFGNDHSSKDGILQMWKIANDCFKYWLVTEKF